MAKLNAQQINALVDSVSEQVNKNLKIQDEKKEKDIEASKEWKEYLSLSKQADALNEKAEKLRKKLEEKYDCSCSTWGGKSINLNSSKRFDSRIVKRDLLIQSIDSSEIADTTKFIAELVAKYLK